MNILQPFIFLSVFIAFQLYKKLFKKIPIFQHKNISPYDDLSSKLVMNNKKMNNRKEIYLLPNQFGSYIYMCVCVCV